MYRWANAVHPVLCLVLCFLCFLCVLVCSSDDCAFLLVLVTLITFTLLLPLLKASCQSSSFPDIANLRKNRHQDKITRNQVTFFKLGTKLSGEGEGNTTYLSPSPPQKACFLFSHCRWILLYRTFSFKFRLIRVHMSALIIYEKTNGKLTQNLYWKKTITTTSLRGLLR